MGNAGSKFLEVTAGNISSYFFKIFVICTILQQVRGNSYEHDK